MKFKISHRTLYKFDAPIFLEPHFLRFRTRPTPFLSNLHFSICVEDAPEGHKVIQDEENNVLDFCWFHGTTSELSISADSIFETKPFNPFDFILQPSSFNQLPFQYSNQQRKLLLPYLDATLLSEEIIQYGDAILKASKGNTIDYLTKLTQQLHKDFKLAYREEGPPLIPSETFSLKKGSCRDLSWLQLHILRYQNIAARFVSGYYYFDMEQASYELHAWVEVFLPGIGWIGIDPSHGIFTGNTHFPLAASAFSDRTMPVSGTIRGAAKSILLTDLSIQIIG